jgi:hypothetical protein
MRRYHDSAITFVRQLSGIFSEKMQACRHLGPWIAGSHGGSVVNDRGDSRAVERLGENAKRAGHARADRTGISGHENDGDAYRCEVPSGDGPGLSITQIQINERKIYAIPGKLHNRFQIGRDADRTMAQFLDRRFQIRRDQHFVLYNQNIHASNLSL